MIIIGYAGYELEKAKPNTSEDFFNRSEVTYILNNKERTFLFYMFDILKKFYKELLFLKEIQYVK